MASGERGIRTGFADGLFSAADPGTRATWLGRAKQANAGIARINVSWRGTAPTKPTAARNPADPAYDFSSLDAAVRSARGQGLEPLLTVLRAPNWAEGKRRPSLSKAPEGTWKPNPKALGDFGFALARRYSGSFLGLPRVKLLQAWNEQNLTEYLTPQYKGRRQVSAGIYRKMLNAFYSGVKAAVRSDRVVAGGTGPFGDPAGGDRTRPLRFWRGVMCLKGNLEKDRKCKGKTRFDVLAHHPISTSGGPFRHAISDDDATIPDMKDVQRTLHAAERRNTVGGPRRHPLWATEIWWESNPPDRAQGVKARKQALWLDQALYLLWKQRVEVAVNLQIRDSKFTRATRFNHDATGIYYFSGKPKPSRKAFSFPLYAKGAGGRKVKVWGKAPGGGRVAIQVRKGKRWRKAGSARASGNGVFTTKVRARGKPTLRAVRNGVESYTYRVGAGKG